MTTPWTPPADWKDLALGATPGVGDRLIDAADLNDLKVGIVQTFAAIAALSHANIANLAIIAPGASVAGLADGTVVLEPVATQVAGVTVFPQGVQGDPGADGVTPTGVVLGQLQSGNQYSISGNITTYSGSVDPSTDPDDPAGPGDKWEADGRGVFRRNATNDGWITISTFDVTKDPFAGAGPSGTPTNVTWPGVQSMKAGTAITPLPIVASGGNGTFVFSGSGLPAGVSLNAATGVLTGTPTTAGSYKAIVTVTSNGTTDSTTFAITVATTTTPGTNGQYAILGIESPGDFLTSGTYVNGKLVDGNPSYSNVTEILAGVGKVADGSGYAKLLRVYDNGTPKTNWTDTRGGKSAQSTGLVPCYNWTGAIGPVLDGTWDANFTAVGKSLPNYSYFTCLHEPNVNGKYSDTDFINGYNHIMALIRAANSTLVLGPVFVQADVKPGYHYVNNGTVSLNQSLVDMWWLDAYDGIGGGSGGVEMSAILKNSVPALQAIASKPWGIAECGSIQTGAAKVTWLLNALKYVASDPKGKALISFGAGHTTDASQGGSGAPVGNQQWGYSQAQWASLKSQMDSGS